MRARALGMPFFVPLGDGLLTAGFLGQLELLAEFGELRRAVVVGDGSAVTSPASPQRSMPVDRLAHMRADLRNVRLVDRLDVLAPDRHDLQLRDELAPAAVGLAGGVARLEEDRVVVVAVRPCTSVTCPSYGSIFGGVDHARCQVGRALVLDDAAGDLHAAAALTASSTNCTWPLVVEVLELLVRDRRDLDVEASARRSGRSGPSAARVSSLVCGTSSPARTASISPTNRTSAPALAGRSRRRRPARHPATSRPG